MATECGKSFPDTIIAIRLLPKGSQTYAALMRKHANVRVLTADPSFAATDVEPLFSEKANTDFVSLLKYSDVTVNMSSTTSIDAAVFDKPIVNIAYNISYRKNAYRMAKNTYSSAHYANIVKTGGVRLARSTNELVKEIGEYLKYPSRDHNGRKSIVEEQCWRIDGKAGQRMIDVIEEFR
jgi:CDP-glycerol glycerophosphotransferase (TagB/SpsB family)